MSVVKKKGFDFSFDPRACENCPGYCCIGESGNTWVSDEEISEIADFLARIPTVSSAIISCESEAGLA